MSGTTSLRILAGFVLIAGGACISLLTFGIYFSFTFTLFVPVTAWGQVLANASIAGAVPLIMGAMLLFFRQTEKSGVWLTLVGSVILNAYLLICYLRLTFQYMDTIEKTFWFFLIPATVLAVDAASYKIYKLTRPPAEAKTVAAHAG